MFQRPLRPRESTSLGNQPYARMVEAHFDVQIRTGDEWMVRCGWHENTGTPSMQVNVRTGMFLCFNPTCSVRGGPKKLTAFCHEKFIDAEVDVSEIIARLNMLEAQSSSEHLAPRVMSESMVSRYKFPTDYWTNRGFTQVTQDAFDMGYDPIHNNPTIALRALDGSLTGFLRRDMSPDAVVKYRNPKHYKKSHNLFGAWMAYKCSSDLVVVCEGPTDAIKVWQAGFCAVAQYGSQISPEQVRLIRRMGFGQVVLFYDNDAAGKHADAAARGQKQHLRNNKTVIEYDPALDLTRDFLVSRADYTGINSKDPGGMDDYDIMAAVVGATPVM